MKLNIKRNSQTLFFGFSLIILALIITSFIIYNNLSASFSKKTASLASLKGQLVALQNEQLRLNLAKKQISKYSGLQTIADQIVPKSKNQAESILQIVNIASQNNITIDSISLPSSALGTGSSANSAPSTAPANSSLSALQAKQAASALAQDKIAIATSQLTAVNGIPGVYILPIQVLVTSSQNAVSYQTFYNFINDLQDNRLTSQINDITINPLSSNPNMINFSLTVNIYIQPTL